MSGASFAATSFARRPTFTPSFVDNTGTGIINWDGAGIGVDSTGFEVVFCLKNIDANTTLARLWADVSSRVQISLQSTGRVTVALRTSTPSLLVDWTSSNDDLGKINTAGERELRIRADLSATNTFEVYKREITGNVAADWVQMTGSFATGPTAGTIDCSRGGQSGNDSSILGSVSGGDICNLHFGYAWRSHATTLQSMDAFGVGGLRVDPRLVTPNDFIVMGPAASLTTDQSSSARSLSTVGIFTDV